MNNTLRVIHDQKNERFYSTIEGKDAELNYKIIDTKVMDFLNVYVPPEFRRQGIAEKIVTRGMEYAKGHGFRVRLSCPYVNNFVKIHRNDYKDMVVQ
jgi:uncharacterized protein